MTNVNFLNLSDSELDQHIYRIMKQEYVLAMFSQNQNVLSQMSNWKDQFENFQLRLGGILNGENFEYGFKNDFVGQCWTRDGYSEAMWGIYANNPDERFLRIRSTPRKLLQGLVDQHSLMPQDTCFVGAVEYKRESELKAFAQNKNTLELSPQRFARSLLLKRSAFGHESEVRLLYFGEGAQFDKFGLYRYDIDPHKMITQIMADPNRDRSKWNSDKADIKAKTKFCGEIKRSKIYDPPDWGLPRFNATI
ncbi:MAG: hypothetical protein NPIRA05_14250 [Nitrospirales bacterium]|nr:MAG: hypothetical protein NPIRA05_14250 [Nitrospirales bacterium]